MENVEGEGLKYFWEELKFLIKRGHWRWIPYALLYNLAQYAGFRLGYIENLIPRFLKKRFSHFWYS
jgi:rhamnosyltransferase